MAARQRLRRSHSRHSLLIQRADREARMRLRPVIRAALPSHLRQLSQLQRHSPLRQQLSQLQQLSRPRQRPSRLQRHPPAMVPPRPIRDRTAQLHRLLPAVHLPAVRGPDLVGPRVLRVVRQYTGQSIRLRREQRTRKLPDAGPGSFIKIASRVDKISP